MPTTRPRSAPPRGTALAEVVVAATVLTVGVLGAVGILANASRETRRARARYAGVAVLTTRSERWRTSPCIATAGEQRSGALVERWRSTRTGALATLADTVSHDAYGAMGDGTQRIGIVAVAWCAP